MKEIITLKEAMEDKRYINILKNSHNSKDLSCVYSKELEAFDSEDDGISRTYYHN